MGRYNSALSYVPTKETLSDATAKRQKQSEYSYEKSRGRVLIKATVSDKFAATSTSNLRPFFQNIENGACSEQDSGVHHLRYNHNCIQCNEYATNNFTLFCTRLQQEYELKFYLLCLLRIIL